MVASIAPKEWFCRERPLCRSVSELTKLLRLTLSGAPRRAFPTER